MEWKMNTHKHTNNEIASIENRIKEKLREKDWLAAWETLRVPDNKASRAYVHAVFAGPKPKATISAWRDWIDSYSRGEFAVALSAHETERANEIARKDAEYAAKQLADVATTGKRYSSDGVIYPHALAFVRHKIDDGWRAVKSGIGIVRFEKGDWYTRNFRDRRINAALELLAIRNAKNA